MTKILLVEDDKSLREIYGVRLQAEGYEIVSAGDGEEALAVAIKERPTLILSDVMMPKISGFDMLDILRSTTETKDVKVIMMTALSSEDQRARGEALGANRYLVKSQVGIEDVVRTVHDVLGDSIAAPSPTPSFPPVSQPTTASEATPPAPVTPIAITEPVAAPAEPIPTITLPPLPEPVAAPVPAPAPPPEPTPAVPPQATAPPSIPLPQPSVLPEPTAPFSTPRTGSIGDRVINPLPSANNLSSPAADLATQMNQELNTTIPVAAPPQPPVPPAPSA